jgi:hypothetical protein
MKLRVTLLSILCVTLLLFHKLGSQFPESYKRSCTAVYHAPVGRMWNVLTEVGQLPYWYPPVKQTHLFAQSIEKGDLWKIDLGYSSFSINLLEIEPFAKYKVTMPDDALPVVATWDLDLIPEEVDTILLVKQEYRVPNPYMRLVHYYFPIYKVMPENYFNALAEFLEVQLQVKCE